jgi:excisionase family DNA binding protein
MLDFYVQEKIEEIFSSKIIELETRINNKLLTHDPYLSRSEAANYLSCSLSTIDNYVRWRKLPKYKLGKSTRFKTSDLDALLINTQRA